MYGILPLEAPNLGIALPLVGILLSANRLIRLGSNTLASTFFERWGPRRPFLASVLLGLVSTVLYGVAQGFAIFLFARILWGIAWSGLRQGGYQAVWSGNPAVKGRLMGLLWGLIRLGSAFAVFIGGLLFDQYGYGIAVGVMVGVSMLAIPVAWGISWPLSGDDSTNRLASRQSTLQPSTPTNRLDRVRAAWRVWASVLDVPMRRWLTGAGFLGYLLHSVVVSTTSLFLASRLSNDRFFLGWTVGVATLTGFLLAVRWVVDLTLAPALGYLSDRLGQAQTAALLVCGQFAGLIGAVILPPMAAISALLLVYLCDGGLNVTLSAAASGAAIATVRPHLFVGVFTTATDAGSAMGPLLAYSIAGAVGFGTMYLGFGLLFALTIWRYWWLTQRTLNVQSRPVGT